jgi:hypothetical protein
MSISIVKFKNGKYGIMKRNIFNKIFKQNGVYMDFNPVGGTNKWRSSRDYYFKDCQLDSIEKVTEFLQINNNKFVEVEFKN